MPEAAFGKLADAGDRRVFRNAIGGSEIVAT
jgi:hypothetical protein